ncbi:MAG: ROK family protein [Verrucomicrobiales bacterium]|nr:ROK family protein [Verrucomicrobiales bacterium]
MAESNKEYLLGVDLGGTKILCGVFSEKLECLGRSKKSTKAQRGADAVVDRVAACVLEAIDECDLHVKQARGLGIGAPGACDPDSGTVIFAPNLGWKNFPLKKELEKRLNLPVFIENDCNLQTLGVYAKELQSKPKSLVGIFLGTGIGAGIIFDGKPFSGFNRTAGEIGHMVLQVGGPKCACGNKGCFEALASRSAIFKTIEAAVKDGQKTSLTDLLGPGLEDMRSGDLRKAIKRGDKLVERIIEEAAEYTGIAVANVINLLNPEVVVIGGGLMDALEDDMMAIIIETAHDYAMNGTDHGIEILPSKLGDDAGITGGAVLTKRSTK